MGNINTTHLHIPSIRESHDLDFDPHPTKVKAWIEQLPLADTGRTARMIYSALVTMNRTLITMQHRNQILELFREPTHRITEALKKYYIGQAFPLAEKNHKAAMLARELNTEMANGYKIVLSSLLTNQTPIFTAGKSLTPLHRAMHYLIELLITSYQTYAPSPAATWHDIHQIYHYAEIKALAKSPLHDGNHKMPSHHNIENLYKKALLLSIAGTYHLSQAEITTVFSALDEWASYSTLDALFNADDPPEAFIINQGKDEPISFLTTNRVRLDKSRILNGCLTLDTTQLVNHLRSIAGQTSAKTASSSASQISPALLRRLISSWSMASKRNFSRFQKNTTLVIGLGLQTAHYLVKNNVRPSSSGKQGTTTPTGRAQFTSRELGVAANELSKAPDDAWDVTNQTAYARTQQGLLNDKDIDNPLQGTSIYATYTCKVVNESAGGACLSWEGNTTTTTLRIGEIIAVHTANEDNTSEWGIAAIRWMKNTSTSAFEFGIQMLTPAAEAVEVRNANTENSKIFAVLFLPELKAINQPATLIAETNSFQIEDEVLVQTNDATQQVVLNEVLDDSGVFTQFRFMPAAALHDPQTPATIGDKQKELELLWAAI